MLLLDVRRKFFSLPEKKVPILQFKLSVADLCLDVCATEPSWTEVWRVDVPAAQINNRSKAGDAADSMLPGNHICCHRRQGASAARAENTFLMQSKSGRLLPHQDEVFFVFQIEVYGANPGPNWLQTLKDLFLWIHKIKARHFSFLLLFSYRRCKIRRHDQQGSRRGETGGGQRLSPQWRAGTPPVVSSDDTFTQTHIKTDEFFLFKKYLGFFY